MKTKYETPAIEVYKFALNTNVLTASRPTDTPESSFADTVIGGGEGGDNPFI